MKNFIYVVVCCALIMSCKPGIPKDLIQPDKMALVLHDIHLFDGYIGTLTNRTSATKIAAGYYRGIYKKYGIDSALYHKSLTYYYANPKIMEEIYTEVTGKLKRERDGIVRADSLSNVRKLKLLKAKGKADSAKVKADSVRKADSVKIAAERKKLIRQLDSLKKAKFSPEYRRKARADSLRMARRLKKRADSLQKVEKLKAPKRAKTIN